MSSTFIIEDNTDEAIRDIEDAVDTGLKRAALYVENEIVRSMPPNPKVEAGEGGWKKSFGRRAKSSPGSPPMQQTGNLVRNIISGKIGRLQYGVGTRRGYSSVPYGFFLDQGTTKMAARPWLGRVFTRKSKQISDQFYKGFDHAMRSKK